MPVFIVVLQEHAQEEHKKLLESITTMLAKSLSQRTELVSGHLKNRNQLSHCTTATN
jgi:phenylpyruvate tautomerase PptA (4-oxalocrotonate tautomerase family)